MNRQVVLIPVTVVATAGVLLLLGTGLDRWVHRKVHRALATFAREGYRPATIRGRVGEPMPPVQPAPGSQALGITFTISPQLPAGLSLNPGNGVVSGTPRATAPLTSYRATAQHDHRSATTTLQLTITAR
jgi:hypothetical protein